jgi:hypothetical protein
MTFFLLIPLGLLLVVLGQAAVTIFALLAVLLVFCLTVYLGLQTGHPGVFWACLIGGGIGLVLALEQHARWRVRRFVRFARTQLELKQDAIGWELYDRNKKTLLPILRGYVPKDKIWFCKQNPQSIEARRLMEPSASLWAYAIRMAERNKCINTLCAAIPRQDLDSFMASGEFKRKVAAVELPYITLEQRFKQLETSQRRRLARR